MVHIGTLKLALESPQARIAVAARHDRGLKSIFY